jgi:hypothetical protein
MRSRVCVGNRRRRCGIAEIQYAPHEEEDILVSQFIGCTAWLAHRLVSLICIETVRCGSFQTRL